MMLQLFWRIVITVNKGEIMGFQECVDGIQQMWDDVKNQAVDGGYSQAHIDAIDAQVKANVITAQEALDKVNAAYIGQSAASIGYATKADLDADLTPADGVLAIVTNDATATNNGTYRKSGATGAGSWVQSSYDRVALVEEQLNNIVVDTVDKNDSVHAVSGKAVFEVIKENTDVGSIENIWKDNGLEEASSFLSGSYFTNDGDKTKTVSRDTNSEITGFENCAKYAYPSDWSSTGTMAQCNIQCTSSDLIKNKINAFVKVKSEATIKILVGFYAITNSATVEIEPFHEVSLYANEEHGISLSGVLTQDTINNIDHVTIVMKSNEPALIQSKSMFISVPFVYVGEWQNGLSTYTDEYSFMRAIGNIPSAKLQDSMNLVQRTPYIEAFNQVGLTGSPIISNGTSTGFTETSRASYAFVQNTLFGGYNNMLQYTGTSDKGTRSHYILSKDDLNINELSQRKKINWQTTINIPIDCDLMVGIYITRTDGNNRWLNDPNVPFSFEANTSKYISVTGILTDDDITNISAMHFYFRDSSAWNGDLNGITYYSDSYTINYGEVHPYMIAEKKNAKLAGISAVDCWGDSITAAGKYEQSLSSELGIPANNFGVSSTWSQMIRQRFVDYYTSNPDEINNFIIIFMGTNNLLNFNTAGNGNDEKLSQMYAKSYNDQMRIDIKIMVDMIPHNNYLIVNGHAGTNVNMTNPIWTAMDSLDTHFVKTFPTKTMNLREMLMIEYDYLGVSVTADFTKPSINESVDISLSDTSWINNSTVGNNGNICIGTKDYYDTYTVTATNGNVATCKLIADKTAIPSGNVMQASYSIVADLDRGTVNIPLRVYSDYDIDSYENNNIPRSATVAGIHPTDDTYNKIGLLFAKKILE